MKFIERVFFVLIIFSLLLFSSISAQTGASLTFSEVLFYPNETNGEFIEIYNTSTTQAVDLTSFKIKYYTSNPNTIIMFAGGSNSMILQPGKYAVILQGSYDYANGIYKNLIPADALVLKIATNSFGTSGMADQTSRDINLINLFNQTIDTYNYSADNSRGYSDEKIILDKNNAAANWANALQLNGTPGKKNTVSPADYDLAATIVGISPANPVTEDSVAVTVKVKNLGRFNAANYTVDIYNDLNLDSQGTTNERIFTNNYTNLAVNDSIIIVVKKVYAAISGDYGFVAQSTYAQDEKVSNDKAVLMYVVSERPANFNDVVINEIMYAPSTDEPEWIEIYNKSNR